MVIIIELGIIVLLAAFVQRGPPGQGPIILRILSCSGSEETLLDCSHELFDDSDQPCGHNQDLSISCVTEAEAGKNHFNQQIQVSTEHNNFRMQS